MRILVLNSGSSTLKADLYQFEREEVDQLPAPEPVFQKNVDWPPGTELLLDELVQQAGHVDAVGHRIVHGGPRYHEPTRITAEVRHALAGTAEIAPVHTGRAMEAVDGAVHALGVETPQIAVFDTAFHFTLPPAAHTYAVPLDWLVKDGIRRYGFHGLSYQYASRRAVQLLENGPIARLLVCHLGSGASLCAIRDGKSVDTTMGFTPLEGLVMSTRSGSIDPGVLFYLQRHKGYSTGDLERILNQESGLAGLSGISGDMRKILAGRAAGDSRAALAFDVYMHNLVRQAGMMMASLGGLDALVFTGGVGENSAPVRQSLCDSLAYLGIRIDPVKNAHVEADTAIQQAGSPVPLFVIHAREEWEIARACAGIL